MKYDFETNLCRCGKDSIAVDVPKTSVFYGKTKEGFEPIPMWVADMNFATVPTVQEAIQKRIEHPCFGYYQPTDEYYNAIFEWQRRQNGVEGLTRENIGYENGVLGGVVSALNVLCSKGDHVLVHSPTYIGFKKTLYNNGYHIVNSDLVLDEDNVWRMDLKDMEEKIVEHKIHTCIFCSPHNPCGRVWTREELEAMFALFEKYQVYVIADEIWSDLILNGNKHIPTQSVNEYAKYHTVAMYSLSKTFSLAGFVASYHISYDKWLSDRLEKQGSLSMYNHMNVLSMHALIGAYKEEGYEWLDELKQVLSNNVNYACKYIEEHFEGVSVSKPQGTYMLFIDCKNWCKAHNKTIDELQARGIEYGIHWQDGRQFNGEYCIRLNLALPFNRIEEAFERMNIHVFNKTW